MSQARCFLVPEPGQRPDILKVDLPQFHLHHLAEVCVPHVYGKVWVWSVLRVRDLVRHVLGEEELVNV